MKEVEEKNFQLEHLQQGFRDLEQTDPAFENLFEDIDLYSKKLGTTPQKQNETISKIRSSRLLPKLKTEETDSLCVAENHYPLK